MLFIVDLFAIAGLTNHWQVLFHFYLDIFMLRMFCVVDIDVPVTEVVVHTWWHDICLLEWSHIDNFIFVQNT